MSYLSITLAIGAVCWLALGVIWFGLERSDGALSRQPRTVPLPPPVTADEWCRVRGVPVHAGMVRLYKALPDDLVSGRKYGKPILWVPGATITAPDWSPAQTIGGGLHLCATAVDARRHGGCRFLVVETSVDELVPLLNGKCKVRTVRVLQEVDYTGRPMVDQAVARHLARVEAARVLGAPELAVVPVDPHRLAAAYRAAMRAAHPDHGGTEARVSAVLKAREVLAA